MDVENDSLLEEQGSMLHYACDQNKVNLSKYLIEKAVPLNTENPLKVTPLCIATHRGYEDICIALLEAGADPNQILLDSKLCPLNYAAKYGRARLVKELVKYGATANRDDISEPIIHSAVSGGNYDVTKYVSGFRHRHLSLDRYYLKYSYVDVWWEIFTLSFAFNLSPH